jgi:predicted metalloendopeptidase
MKIVAALLLLASACTSAQPKATPPGSKAGIDLQGMDPSVAPGDDFFAYANGAWMKSTEIPPDRSSWGTGGILTELTAKRTADLIAEAARIDAPAGSDARKIGDYYASFMDEAGIEAKGLAPLEPLLHEIAGISDLRALSRYLGGTLRADVDAINATNFYTVNIFGL